MNMRKQKTKRYDADRHALQAPIARYKACVIYRSNGPEKRSPWFYLETRAKTALKLMQAKYGERNAILFRD
jgi:hypothetical protein